jgi:hypothetical protein
MTEAEDTADFAGGVLLHRDECDDPRAVYQALSVFTQFIAPGPALAIALAQALADCLRTVPSEHRGAATRRLLDDIGADVRGSLQ